jgi:23S rRNA G2445 N2-methylase RlmL
MCDKLTLSSLGHTWILDLDGTVVKHNGYKIDGHDTFLDGAKDFLDSIPKDDMVIFITSRIVEYKEITENFLAINGIKYDYIIYNAPYGERILINDNKPSGLKTAHSINIERNEFCNIELEIKTEL